MYMGKLLQCLLTKQQMLLQKTHLCICIRYFSEKEMRVATVFVGMVEVVQASGDNLF